MITSSDFSGESSLIWQLPAHQEVRAAALLESYLIALEQGAPPSIAELTKDDPDLAPLLDEYVNSLRTLHQVSTMPAVSVTSGVQNADGPNSPLREESGRQMGDFRLLEVIGRGGMGTVYRAHQVSLNRTVAVKVLPLASALDHRQITRFRNEAAIMASLDHPHIVPVYAIGCENDIHFYAMRLIDGPSIDEVIRNLRGGASSSAANDGTLGPFTDWRYAVELAMQAADALHAAHEMGIVHRDIKPSNLMLDEKGQVCITDFGLAHCQSEYSLTKSGDVVGTAKYMSPEQAVGESAVVDGRSDVYSLAVTLYEMISLRPIHGGPERAALGRTLAGDAPPPLRQLRPGIPRDLDVVLVKAMSVSRDDRYETAKSFADDLSCVLAGRPTTAKPPTTFDRILAWAITHRRAAATLLLIGAATLLTSAFNSARIAATKRASDDAAAQARRHELLARGAIDNLGVRMAELLSGIPAAEPVRRELLTQTLEYYERMAADPRPSENPIVHRDLAITYGKMGTLQRDLGLTSAAVETQRQSEALYARLASANSDDHNLAIEWATSQNNLADMLRQNGAPQEAADWFAKAIAGYRHVLEKAERATSTYEGAQKSLASSLNNLGLLLASVGDVENAETAYRQAIQNFSSDKAAPHDARQLAAIRSNASALLAKSQPRTAIKYARQALDTQLNQLSENNQDAKLATQVVATFCSLGESYAAQQQHQRAIESFKRSAKIGKQLVQRWPAQPTYRRDLVVSWNHLGLSQSALGLLEDARRTFKRAVSYQTELSLELPDNAELQNMLAGALNNLGFIHEQLGEPREARRCYQEAVQHQQMAMKLAPAATRFQRDWRTHQQNLSNLERPS